MPYRYLEHESDEGIEARGGTRGEAYAAAIEGMLDMMAPPEARTVREERVMVIDGDDEESLFVRTMNAVLLAFDADRFLPRDAAVSFPAPFQARVVLRGAALPDPLPQFNVYVKAVTYHQLSITHRDGEWVIRCFVDV